MADFLNALGDPEKVTLISVLMFIIAALGATVVYLFKNCCQKLGERLFDYMHEDHKKDG